MNPCIEYTFTCKSILIYFKKKRVYRVSYKYLYNYFKQFKVNDCVKIPRTNTRAIPYLGNFHQSLYFCYHCELFGGGGWDDGKHKVYDGLFLCAEVGDIWKRKSISKA